MSAEFKQLISHTPSFVALGSTSGCRLSVKSGVSVKLVHDVTGKEPREMFSPKTESPVSSHISCYQSPLRFRVPGCGELLGTTVGLVQGLRLGEVLMEVSVGKGRTQ